MVRVLRGNAICLTPSWPQFNPPCTSISPPTSFKPHVYLNLASPSNHSSELRFTESRISRGKKDIFKELCAKSVFFASASAMDFKVVHALFCQRESRVLRSWERGDAGLGGDGFQESTTGVRGTLCRDIFRVHCRGLFKGAQTMKCKL